MGLDPSLELTATITATLAGTRALGRLAEVAQLLMPRPLCRSGAAPAGRLGGGHGGFWADRAGRGEC